MKNPMSLLRWASLCCLSFALNAICVHVAVSADLSQNGRTVEHLDTVIIKAKSRSKITELPPVAFPHDAHTLMLSQVGKDCTACHDVAGIKNTNTPFDFVEAGTQKIISEKEEYHDNCIGCHELMAGKLSKTGPVTAECRSCHTGDTALNNGYNPARFSKFLHNKHIESQYIPALQGESVNCASCHHVYNFEKKELEWKKHTEDSCASCHMTENKKTKTLKENAEAFDDQGKIADRLTLKNASHNLCIGCHVSVAAKGVVAPVDCAGCHGSQAAAKASAVILDDTLMRSVPRLDRGQPDTVTMTPTTDISPAPKNAMPVTVFSHKLHEAVVADCRTCHHAQISSCSTCHTLEGKKEGDFKSLSMVMHDKNSSRSCVGCHNAMKKQPDCAGCHATLPKGMTAGSCSTCHTPAKDLSVGSSARTNAATNATSDLSAIQEIANSGRISLSDIPETVVIGILADQYEPSVMPHQKIVLALQEKTEGSSLASSFHKVGETVCQACHHYSAPSKTPPACVSCHAVVSVNANDKRPPLKLAYHQQCTSCHEQMMQYPLSTDCAGCHEPRKN